MDLTRRRLLAGAAAASIAGLAVSGCQSDSRADPALSGAVPLPDYIPYSGVAPDLAGSADGVSSGFLTYPSDRRTMSPSPPGRNSVVTSLSPIDGTVPFPLARNQYWQELNKRLAVDWQPDLVPGGQYSAKLATVLAGGEVPDLVNLPHRGVPNIVGTLDHYFADLTPFLEGDAIAGYAALANIPTLSWRSAVFDGKICGIPIPRDPIGRVMMVREDMRRAVGATDPVETTDDFEGLCEALRGFDKDKNFFPLSYPQSAIGFALEAFRVPSGWSESGGKFTNAIETDEMREALTWMAKLWKSKFFHPESFTTDGAAQNGWFYTGRTALRYDTPGFGANSMKHFADPDATISSILPVGGNGQKGRKILSDGLLGITAIKKGDSDRVEELLEILNWKSAPMGTEESLFSNYGIEGHSFTWDDGEPQTLTDVTRAENNAGAPKIAAGPQVLYIAGNPELTQAQHDYEVTALPDGVFDPTIGLHSDTFIRKGAALSRQIGSTQTGIIQGQKTLDDWDADVARWRTNGGDDIRAEYAAAHAQVHG